MSLKWLLMKVQRFSAKTIKGASLVDLSDLVKVNVYAGFNILF